MAGRALAGRDALLAIDRKARAAFDARHDAAGLAGIPFQIRFHLHPDVTAEPDPDGGGVTLFLRSGETWQFRHDGVAEMRLDASVYLQSGQLRPRAAQQVVLSGRAMGYATRIRWSLAGARSTEAALRDLGEDLLAYVDPA